MSRKTYITGEDIKDGSVTPQDIGVQGRGAFVKVNYFGSQLIGQPGRIVTSPPQIRHLQDAVGIEIPWGGIFQKAAILDGMPDLFLFAHRKYQVKVTAGANSLYEKPLFDGRGNSAILIDPTDSDNYPILIEVQDTSSIVHGGYALFVLHDWRYNFSKTSYGGKLIDWEVWVLNSDTGDWQKALGRSNAEDVFPFVFTVGSIRVSGIKVVINKAEGSSWSPNLLYLTGFSCYYTGGGAPWDAVGAISLAGGRIYGNLSFHEDATIDVNAEYTLSTSKVVVDNLRWNGDQLEMHKTRYVFKKGFLISYEDLGWEPVPKV